METEQTSLSAGAIVGNWVFAIIIWGFVCTLVPWRTL